MDNFAVQINPRQPREAYLDGLRGIAALIVVFFHFLSAYTPQVVPDQTATPYWISDTPLAILYNGNFSVAVFFVLSGFVVAASASKRSKHVILNCLLRYSRLAVPATASIIFAWVLLFFMPNEATKLNALIPHIWLQGTYQGADIPNIFLAIRQGLFDIFKNGYCSFNNVLWTMKIELIGSLAIYIAYGLTKPDYRWIVLLALGIATLIHPHLAYEGFVFGALLREARAYGRLHPIIPIPIFILGIILGSESTGFYDRIVGFPIPQILMLGAKDGIIYPVAAAMIVYSVITSTHLQSIFSNTVARFLGRISFSLYLVHVPCLYTLYAMAYLALWPISGLQLTALGLVFLTTSILLGFVFTLVVDEPTLNINKAVRNWWQRLLDKQVGAS